MRPAVYCFRPMGDTDGELDRLGSRVLESDGTRDARSTTEDDSRRDGDKPRPNPEAQVRRNFLPPKLMHTRSAPRPHNAAHRVSQSDGETSDQVVLKTLRHAAFVNRLGGFQAPQEPQEAPKQAPRASHPRSNTQPAPVSRALQPPPSKHPSIDDSEFDTDALALDGDAAATHFQPAPITPPQRPREAFQKRDIAAKVSRDMYERVPSPENRVVPREEPETPFTMVSKISRRMETRVKTDWPATPTEYMEKYTVMLSRITKMMEGPTEEFSNGSVSTHLDIVCPVLRMRRHQNEDTTAQDAMQYMYEALVVCDEIVLERYSSLLKSKMKQRSEEESAAIALGKRAFLQDGLSKPSDQVSRPTQHARSELDRSESEAHSVPEQPHVQTTMASEIETNPEYDRHAETGAPQSREDDRMRPKPARRRQMNVSHSSEREHRGSYHHGAPSRAEPARHSQETARRSAVEARQAEYVRRAQTLHAEQSRSWWPFAS
jgi:hypothetical protein